ncbi:hypothetical protein [Virgibacillus pantothenticus]|nr:hypothetical protein [Virgibacillus pantothenticus]
MAKRWIEEISYKIYAKTKFALPQTPRNKATSEGKQMLASSLLVPECLS